MEYVMDLQPSRASYNALKHYEGTVDRLSTLIHDELYIDFPYDMARAYCLVNRIAMENERSRFKHTPIYSAKRYKEFVAKWFETTVKEMDYNWRHIK